MSFACPICGETDAALNPRHRCSKRALDAAEARYRREEAEGETEDPEPTFDERLADGFKMMEGADR